jgi:hypothetical protein
MRKRGLTITQFMRLERALCDRAVVLVADGNSPQKAMSKAWSELGTGDDEIPTTFRSAMAKELGLVSNNQGIAIAVREYMESFDRNE